MSSSWLLAVLLLLLLLSSAVLVLRWARRRRRPPPTAATVTRSVVYLVAGSQLLVMHRDRTSRRRARLEVPKGKVMAGETTVEAARRECLEESGLRPAALVRLASFQTRQRSGKHRGRETWHAYWGNVPEGTVLPFTHQVSGDGRDRGRVLHYHLEPLDAVVLDPPLDRVLPALRRAVRTRSSHAP